MIPSRSRSRAVSLSLQPLEDRSTPATAVYSAATQTLTLTGANTDALTVSALINKPTGYLSVANGMGTVFSSDTNNQAVRNLVVRFNSVATGTATLDSSVRLGGNLTVMGGRTSQLLTLAGTIGGNVTVTGTGAAVDDVTIEDTALVAGNLTLNLGAGNNFARLRAGTIRGNLAVNALAGNDTVELTATGDLTVGGSASFNLGNGTNLVQSLALPQTFPVGPTSTFHGGTGKDTFDLDGSGIALRVGGDAAFMLSTPTGTDSNVVKFEALAVGRKATFTGGLGDDTILFTGGLVEGGNFTAGLGGGHNSFQMQTPGTSLVGGTFTYTGGAGLDEVSVDGTTVGRGLTVNLGGTDSVGQFFRAGAGGASAVTVFGPAKVTAGSGDDEITLHRLYAGSSLTVAAGWGEDVVGIDASDVAGTTRIDLGSGDDGLRIEMATLDGGGALNAPTTFGGTVAVLAGAGDDTVQLSSDSPMN